jgi:hypothetical protein
MAISRQSLFRKLGATLFRSAESTTAYCKLRGNPYVEPVHWLHQLMQQPDSDLHRVLRHCGIDQETLDRDMARALAALPAGASSIIDFSHHVDNAIERAWLITSLSMNERRIRSAWLLAALLTTPELRRVQLSISPAFAKIPVDGLTEALPAWIDGSPEANEVAHDNSDYAPALPGEASQALPGTSNRSTLEQYCNDLTARARAGEIDPVVGRELEIRTMIDVLLRRRQNNPLLTGEAGVGKTAVVEGLALAIVHGEVPPKLANVRLLALDVGALLAGASMEGEFEARLKGVLEAAAKSPVPVILFVDEIHTLIGAGGQAGTGDAANLLKPALARGTIHTIGATAWAEYKRHIEKDPALTRRFQVLQVAEPEELAAIDMVRGLAKTFAQHHSVVVLDEAIRAAVRLSHRYIPSRQLSLARIVRLHLDRVVRRMAETHQIELTYDEAVVDYIVGRCIVQETGARVLIGFIEQHTLPPTLLPLDMNAANSIKAEAGGFKPTRYSFPDATVPRSVLHNLTRVYAYDRRRDVPIVSSAGDWVIAECYPAGSHIPCSRFRLLGDQVQRQEEFDRTGRTIKIVAIGWAPRTVPDDDTVDTSELGEHPAWIRVFSVSPSGRKTLVAIAWRTKRFATASAADGAPDDKDLVFGLPDGEVRWQAKNAFLKANNIDLGARRLTGMTKAAKS